VRICESLRLCDCALRRQTFCSLRLRIAGARVRGPPPRGGKASGRRLAREIACFRPRAGARGVEGKRGGSHTSKLAEIFFPASRTTHTHAAHDWLGSRHEAHCHRPSVGPDYWTHTDHNSQDHTLQRTRWRYEVGFSFKPLTGVCG